MEKTIAILGAGNLGISIARGMTEIGMITKDQLVLTRRQIEPLVYLKEEGFQVITDNIQAVKNSKVLVVCVQPGQLQSLIREIADEISDQHVIVSVLTGVSIKEIESLIGVEIPVLRAMPNTAIAVGESMTCIATNQQGKGSLEEVHRIFSALGETLFIDESLMQAATVLGASGIAFFMRYLRAATQGGIQMGFHPDQAQKIAVQTAKGAATLVLENNSHPEVEIDKVTTPKGCTIEGLNEMEHQGFSSSLIKGLMTSYHKINDIKK